MELSEEIMNLGRSISQSEKADIYLWNGPINEEGLGELVSSATREQENGILILTTFGGSANSAYRAARYMQTLYASFTVVVPSFCKSAGTLITLGAHRLIMTEFAELGPLDVQLVKRDELGERRSGLLLRSALTHLNEHSMTLFSHFMMSIKSASGGLIRFKLASELAAEMTTGLLSDVYCQIPPEMLGQDYQDLMVAYEYGKRLASFSGSSSEEAIYHIIHGYPSHDFVIDKREAATLFNEIDDPTPEMYELLSSLGPLAWHPNSKHVTIRSLSKSPTPIEENNDAQNQPGNGSSNSEESEAA